VKDTRRQQALDLLAMRLQSGVVPKVIAYYTAGSPCAKDGASLASVTPSLAPHLLRSPVLRVANKQALRGW
jgi:hypothetical protein